jgi:uncharacterized repeat protein (TIGR02543 family)
VTYQWGIGAGDACGATGLAQCAAGLVCKNGDTGNIASGVAGACHTAAWCASNASAAADCAAIAHAGGSGAWTCKEFECAWAAAAPVATITSGPAPLVNTASATFAFTSSSAATFLCAIDGASFSPCTSPQSYAHLADGAHTFQVIATNAQGVTSGPVSQSWTIDTTPPGTRIDATPNASSTSGTFLFSSTKPGAATFTCSLDGAPEAPCASPYAFTNLAFGSHVFSVRAHDAAGNAAPTPATYSWSITPSYPVNVSIQGVGTVTSLSGDIHCPGQCGGVYPTGSIVQLQALPAPDYDFAGWTGDCAGSAATCTLQITSTPRNVGAIFHEKPLPLTVVVTGTGTVTSSDAQISCPSTCVGAYPRGANAMLVATAPQGEVFAGWSGACSGTSTTCTLNITQATSVSALFRAAQ